MRRNFVVFGLGLFSFFLFMFIGETAGVLAACIGLAVYFFACQFLLSRGNVAAWRKDWRTMLVLDATTFIVVLIMIAVEKPEVILSQGVGILVSACGGTFFGAVLASLTSPRTAERT